jgi:hypothetical protein
LLEATVQADAPAQPYASLPGLLGSILGEDDPSAVAGAPMVDDGQPGGIETVSDLDRWLHGERDREEERRRYEEVYSRMIFPL